jgi:L-ascorbate metabolism protein UlaG (beta-lactamase superfamily)
MTKYYLKPNTKLEPLIWRWYVWPYLIPPLTAACNIVERHLKIMQSYVQNPQIHAQAIKDPKMLGGPFIDLEGQKVIEIKNLIENTKKDCAELIALNKAFKEADKIIQNEAKGQNLKDLYGKIPPMLRGFVEIVYDLNNHPSLRLIEPLLYNTYYNSHYQEIAISNADSDFRKFVLSTPRLDQENEVYLNIPFSDKRLDCLYRLKKEPSELKDIKNLFEIPKIKEKLFESFFTTTPPQLKTDNHYYGEGVRIRYFGHACILVQTKSISILFDPVISYPIDNSIPRYTFEDLPDHIDFVVITHTHQDHLLFESLLQLRHKTCHIIFPANHKGALEDPSIKLILQHTGFSSLIEINELQRLPIKDGEILALPFFGEHSDLNIQSKLSYSVRLQDKNFIFAADSDNLDTRLYDHIFDLIGQVEILFLGMECDGAPLTWLYGPLLTNPISRAFDRSRTLSGSDYEKAWSIVEKLKCKHAYVYAMGQEPWLNYIMALSYSVDSLQILESDKFVNKCIEKGIISERLFAKKEWII